MGYADEKQVLIDYVTDNGMIIQMMPDRSNEKKYYKELETLSNNKKIAIRYPGYKTTRTKSDYCVYLVDDNGEWPVSHVEIMLDLYGKTTSRNYSYLKEYVENVAEYGKDVEIRTDLIESDSNGFSYEELTLLMFYIAIQEDINYPETYYQGRKMCFYRYLESIYCKLNYNHTIDEAIERAKNKKYIPKNWNDVGGLYDVVSAIRR